MCPQTEKLTSQLPSGSHGNRLKKKNKKPKQLWGLLFFKTITPNYKNVDDKKNAKGENIKENLEW